MTLTSRKSLFYFVQLTVSPSFYPAAIAILTEANCYGEDATTSRLTYKQQLSLFEGSSVIHLHAVLIVTTDVFYK